MENARVVPGDSGGGIPGRPAVQVDSCTGRREDLMAGWHWYDYVFSIPLGMVGFYDSGH